MRTSPISANHRSQALAGAYALTGTKEADFLAKSALGESKYDAAGNPSMPQLIQHLIGLSEGPSCKLASNLPGDGHCEDLSQILTRANSGGLYADLASCHQ
jgi:hypothetical protein